MDDRRGITLVDDPIERNVTEPACRLGRIGDEPFPIVIGVLVDLAARLSDPAVGDDGIVETAPMGTLAWPIQLGQSLREPLTVTMSSRGIDSIRVDLGRQNSPRIRRRTPSATMGLVEFLGRTPINGHPLDRCRRLPRRRFIDDKKPGPDRK